MSGYIVPLWARLALVAMLALAAFGYGVVVGLDHEQAREFKAQQDIAKVQARIDRNASQINHDARQQGAATQVANEDATHASQGRIRTLYRTATVGADCRQPVGVSAELDGAIERANDRVRAAAGAAAAQDPEGGGVPRH